jgi:hypothetical protein
VHCYEPHGTQAFPAKAFSHMVATQNVKLPTGWYKPLTSHISQELNTDSNSKASTRFPNQTTTGSHMGVFETRTANASGSTKRPWGVFCHSAVLGFPNNRERHLIHKPANPFSIQPQTTRNGRSPVSKRAEARDFPAFALGPVSQCAVGRWVLVGIWI